MKTQIHIRTRPLTPDMEQAFQAALVNNSATFDFGGFDMESMTGWAGITCDDSKVETVKAAIQPWVIIPQAA